ncbi:MAG: hypothetical protein HYV04_18125 [Deltaproteobacteria bacterium]|nr:hypothetical protein [Deltaproteobacteria bacterium]
MGRQLLKTNGSEAQENAALEGFWLSELPHVNSPDCWCDPIVEYAGIGGQYVLLHQNPTTH